MSPNERDCNQGATIIPLPRPELGHAGQHSAKSLRLLDRVRAELRSRHYSPRTEKTYVAWIRRFILFHSKRHPETMSGTDVGDFLSHLANQGKVSAGTQNQALAALLFLFHQVLGRRLEWLGNLVHASGRSMSRSYWDGTRCEISWPMSMVPSGWSARSCMEVGCA